MLILSEYEGPPPLNPNPGGAEHHRAEDTSGKPYVWIIEDNSGDVFLMQEAFREHAVNCEIFVVSDGEQAMRLVEDLDSDPSLPCPQLVLLDINLPRRSGHEVLQRIRKGRRCPELPVLIVSSSEASADLAMNQRLGATAYFKKPTGLDAFLTLGRIVSDMLKPRAH